MSATEKRRKVHPLFAIGLLVAGLLSAGSALIDVIGGDAGRSAGSADDDYLDAELDEPVGNGREAVEWRDLLAEYGSFDGGTVRVAFSVFEGGVPAMPAPVGEVAPTQRWDGVDPPELRLGVVMVSERSRRAVVAGRVVGLADEVGGGIVQQITRDKLVLLWHGMALTYDLDDGWPREFRAERARRRQLAEGASAVGEGGGDSVGGRRSDDLNGEEKGR
ncbi:MAG: hypothetical protein KDE27_04850 [Planctomycetes bacterium]|nr:hypothetical protein [Planctomycetota bacterium]